MTLLDCHQIVGCYVVIGLLLLYVALVPLMKPRKASAAPATTISIGRQVALFLGMAFLVIGLHGLMKGY
jgi:hypothetical protein